MGYGEQPFGAGLFGLPVLDWWPDTGGIPVSDTDAIGDLVDLPGKVQYGPMLLGVETRAGWRDLVGWRDTPEVQVADARRPQAHGSYPGTVYGDSLAVTFTYLVRGTPEQKRLALDTIEAHTRLDGVERPLVVDDGTGPWFRMARVIGRQVPQGVHFNHAPLECSVQFLCADPRRYSTTEKTATVTLPTSSDGLAYPLTYPLSYGESASGSLNVTNEGSEPTPPLVEFVGPLTDPVLIASDWSLGFNLTLADGETLTVDTNTGTALLNGTADRLYTIRNDSTPLEHCLLQRGSTTLSLVAPTGTGRVVVRYRDARM